MKSFVVYDPATGEIIRSGTCRSADIAMQARTGEAAIEGRGSDLLYKVDLSSGKIVELPEPKPLPVPKPRKKDLPSPEEIDAAVGVDNIKLLLKRIVAVI